MTFGLVEVEGFDGRRFAGRSRFIFGAVLKILEFSRPYFDEHTEKACQLLGSKAPFDP